MPGGECGAEWDVTPEHLKHYEDAAGRSVAWVYFSHEWSEKPVWPVKCDDKKRRVLLSEPLRSTEQPANPSFPSDTVKWIAEKSKASPFIRLMMRTSAEKFQCESTFTLKAIADGMFDKQLRAWGKQAKAQEVPLICEWGTEMNGMWFPWNAVHNGGPSGAQLFKQAYCHIIDTINGGDLITWVFHVNATDDPVVDWNQLTEYDPGPDYTDWIGVSVYGSQDPNDDEWLEFRPQMDEVYPKLAKLEGDRPIMVCEFGVTSGNPAAGDPDRWADRSLAALLNVKDRRWERVRGFSWWNEAWVNEGKPKKTEMRICKIDKMREVFQRHLGGNKAVVDRPIIH
jgi:beta-mannanase